MSSCAISKGLAGRAVGQTTLVSNHSVTLWRMPWESQPETQLRLILLSPIVLRRRVEPWKVCHRCGLIDEEVAKVYPELVAYDNNGQPYSVRYQYIATMLLNEVQKQYRRAETQAEIIKTQQLKIDDLEQRLTRLESMISNQVQTVAQK